MLNLVRVISNAIESGFRKVKVRRYGNDDIRTPTQAIAFGIDSSPIKGMTAVYADTDKKGKPVVIGYVNKNLLANEGETRFYALDSDGVLSSYIWLKGDGTMLLAGDADNAVRYAALNTALQNLKTALNVELVKIQTGITGVGGAYARLDISVDISAAKINEIKTP